ncbi:DUF2507 domain-containing protein [Salibacterium salarium]|uniref:DUF2507 domain-containing protein n=1 Tax=Salibacterium salarium TaxID=284579 RepID=A0A428N2R7_9BACI|nr:DUF2507 domain-containing protein [Salibacterium salarium]RSL32579.1 DUF2507 domain-containing protein [Salibacterium salarium]
MSYSDNHELHFGYTLLRETLIPELLGSEEADILYWGGKRIARKYPAADTDEIIQFFQEAGWGQLELVNEKKKEIQFELQPLQNSIDRHIEAGYLAQQLEYQKDKAAETFLMEKRKRITFHIQWD